MRTSPLWIGIAIACLALGLAAAPARSADDAAAIQANARKRLPQAGISLAAAIAAAVKKHPEGQAVRATLEIVEGDDDDDANNFVLFSVEVVVGERHFDVEIEGASGACEGDAPIGGELALDKALVEAVARTKFTLARAVGAALDRVDLSGSRAFDARPLWDDGKLVYAVGVLVGEDIYDVRLDGTTGKLLSKQKVRRPAAAAPKTPPAADDGC